MTWYSPPSSMSSKMVSKIPVGVSDQLAECGDGVDTPSVLRVRYQVVTHRAANCDHVSLQPEAPVVYHAGRQHADAPCPSRTVEARHRRKPCTSARESALFGSRFLRMHARFAYASHACATAEDDIPGILAWSRQANPELGVTGVLCFLDGVYMQYIEGEETALEALFSSIRKDARHHDVTLLERRAVPRRAFSEWVMSLLEWDDKTRNVFRSFSPGKNLSPFASDPSTSAPLVRALIRGAGWVLALD